MKGVAWMVIGSCTIINQNMHEPYICSSRNELASTSNRLAKNTKRKTSADEKGVGSMAELESTLKMKARFRECSAKTEKQNFHASHDMQYFL